MRAWALSAASSPADLPCRPPTHGTAVEGGDLAWGASGPFRGPPIAFVLHSTPPGTPQASPRGDSGLPGDGGGDLEAPLLLSNGAKRTHAPFAGPDAGGMVQAVVLGLINTAAGVPALIAFCAVVFKDPMYEPWLDPLSKLFYLSSAVHQAVVSLRSAVPHAVGQVQVRGGGSVRSGRGRGVCAEAGALLPVLQPRLLPSNTTTPPHTTGCGPDLPVGHGVLHCFRLRA